MLGLSRKYGVSRVQFRQDSSKAPHIDSVRIPDSKYDFGSSIEPALDVCVQLLVQEARASEVNYFDTRLVPVLQDNIFRLQVAMDYVFSFHIVQSVEDLNSKPSNQA